MSDEIIDPMPVINFGRQPGFHFDPCDDITVIELAKIIKAWGSVLSPFNTIIDDPEWNTLKRHFEEVKVGPVTE